MKYQVYAKVVGSKYLGEYEADSKAQAEKLAFKNGCVSLCHQCASECEDAEISEVTVVEVNEEG